MMYLMNLTRKRHRLVYTGARPFAKFLLAALVVTWLYEPNLLCDFYPRPLTAKDLVGAWVGCEYNCLEFYRLDLKANGSGSFVRLDFDSTVFIYRIENWRIQEGKLLMTLTPHAKAQPIRFESLMLDRRYVKIQIQGESGWDRTITLFNEKEWEKRKRIAERAAP